MRFLRIIPVLLLLLPTASLEFAVADPEPEKSPYFAYVGREYIFTIEVVKPGTPLLNFVSVTDREENLAAKNVRLFLGNRQVPVKLFVVEADRYQQPLVISSVSVHPRSSFGFRLQGSFDDTTELYGVQIDLGGDIFKLAPLSKFAFETLVRKVDRLNLGSPDFRDDYRVLNLDLLGSRSSRRK
jgi:hypothetical protein